MKRREFVGKLGLGSAVLMSASTAPVGADNTSTGKNDQHHEKDDPHQDHHGHPRAEGPLANVTVSFGAWPSDPPYDRAVPPAPGPPPNVHQLIPHVTTVKVGGAVNFVIAGLHQIAVYGPGIKPTDINAGLLIFTPNFPPLINDPVGRVYRGPNPIPLLPVVDRVEVVHFSKRGLYLVICSVLPHFNDDMYGWVRVVR